MMTISTDASTMTGIELAEAEALLLEARRTLANTSPGGPVSDCWSMAERISAFLKTLGRHS